MSLTPLVMAICRPGAEPEAWYAERYINNFIQLQGPNISDISLVGTFTDTFTWLIDNVTGYDTADFHFLRDDDTVFYGSLRVEQAALNELQFVLSGHPFPALSDGQYLYTNTARDRGWSF